MDNEKWKHKHGLSGNQIFLMVDGKSIISDEVANMCNTAHRKGAKHERDKWRSRIQKRIDELEKEIENEKTDMNAIMIMQCQKGELEGLLK